MIQIFKDVFHLTNKTLSYAMRVQEKKVLHAYWGSALGTREDLVCAAVYAADCGTSRDSAPQEFGERGRGDFRDPAIVCTAEGIATTEFEYAGYEILQKKPAFSMPALRGGGETLVLLLKDARRKLTLRLHYTLFEWGLARRTELTNEGEEEVRVTKLASACLDFPRGAYESIHLSGRWGAECIPTRSRVLQGLRELSSRRGITSHQHNPFLAVLEAGAGEDSGAVYGFNLIYSGNFSVTMDGDERGGLRVNVGCALTDGVLLSPGETLSSPEAVCVFSREGVGGMSRAFHNLYRKHLIHPRFQGRMRPIVLNSWESVYFDFDEEKLLRFIDGAKGLGIDIVVLDDGWFGRRDLDDSSLGDWFIHKDKLPHGFAPLIERCKQHGMKFGLWFEPEAVSPNSELYRAHPDWAIATAGRTGIQMRNQLVLDFSKREVVDYLFDAMSKVLKENDISYVKWDMNRAFTDVVREETYFGHVQGVYDLYERLTAAFPHVLIEGCSSGGGRFDPAILYYSPMIWTSDDTDAFERMRVQYGTSLCYPLETMSNHVSACPNHQTGRTTPLATRGAVASLGCLGYELNVGALGEEERAEIARQISRYRADAACILTGELYRLCDPFRENAFCEEVVAQDGACAYLVYCRPLAQVNLPAPRVKLKGLNREGVYRIEETGRLASGAELMYMGIAIDLPAGDFASAVYHFTRTD